MDPYGQPNSSYNPNQIGFVFDGPGQGAGPMFPENSSYQSSGPPAVPYYPPPQQNFQPQPPYPSGGYDHPGPGPGYGSDPYQTKPWYPEGHGQGPGQVSPYQNYPEGENYNDNANAYGPGGHGSGGGVPGGKLGVLGGAAAAGVGTALVTQLLLPKKLKKNKLVKYGLPIAGAGAGGYALNKMNNEKKWPPTLGK